jgi:hypothetical protein
MNKVTIRLTIALLTFLLGLAATSVWLFKQQPKELRLVIPQASWEPRFFRYINAVAGLTGQSELRKTRLPQGDVEARLWWGFGLSPLEGVTLRRAGGQWSAIHAKADHYYEAEKAERRELRPPRSGWDGLWQRLTGAGILTLPDATEVNCSADGLDGIAFVVETNANHTYRTYKYGNPMLAKCNEAQRMMEIGDLIYEEFGLEEFRDDH